MWTKDEEAAFVESRKRMSAKLDPSVNLPSWCKAEECGSGLEVDSDVEVESDNE
jgi:hypothetical protein